MEETFSTGTSNVVRLLFPSLHRVVTGTQSDVPREPHSEDGGLVFVVDLVLDGEFSSLIRYGPSYDPCGVELGRSFGGTFCPSL